MFVSHYNNLAYQFIQNFDLSKAPVVTIIMGKEGLGKTTLLNYLTQRLKESGTHFILIEAQKFSAKYAYAAYSGDLSAFRKYFRSPKLLLLDNIDRLKGKTRTIEELFHTLDTIFVQGGKAVISYNGDNLDLTYLGERLASRLKSGLVLKLSEPTLEEINHFATYYSTNLNQDSNTIDSQIGLSLTPAQNFKEVVKEINKLAGKTFNEGDRLQESINDILAKNKGIVLSLVTDYFAVEEKEVLGNSKRNNCVRARYMMYVLLNEQYNHSYKQIADHFRKDANSIKQRSCKIKEANTDVFETLCQKLYNQLNSEKSFNHRSD